MVIRPSPPSGYAGKHSCVSLPSVYKTRMQDVEIYPSWNDDGNGSGHNVFAAVVGEGCHQAARGALLEGGARRGEMVIRAQRREPARWCSQRRQPATRLPLGIEETGQNIQRLAGLAYRW
jgi:hypothetical protein